MPTTRTTVLVDAAANLLGAALTASAPRVWSLLGLPESARRPATGALVASGVFHLASAASGTPSPRLLRIGAAINAGWMLAGLTTQGLPIGGAQRAALLTIVSYDATMTLLKAQLGREV